MLTEMKKSKWVIFWNAKPETGYQLAGIGYREVTCTLIKLFQGRQVNKTFMIKHITLIITILLGILLYSPEAWVSGNANISLLKPNLHYTFEENVRRTIHTDEYQEYWKRKNQYLRSVLNLAEAKFKDFNSEVKKNALPLVQLDLTKSMPEKASTDVPSLIENSKTKSVRITIEGVKGTTDVTYQLQRELNEKEAKSLFALTQSLAFEGFADSWDKNDSPEAKNDTFIEGLVSAKYYDLYSLGLSLASIVRKEDAAIFKEALAGALDKLAPKIESGFQEAVQQKRFWLNVKDLIPLKTKMGKQFLNHEEHPVENSVFNFYGPLFDEFGRRTTARWGHFTVSLLFVSKKPWNDKDPLGRNRGQFETWLQEVLTQ